MRGQAEGIQFEKRKHLPNAAGSEFLKFTELKW